jgi:hypothetical protein
MKLFGQIVRTVVNTALVPVAVVADVKEAAMNAVRGDEQVGLKNTREQIETLKDEADED